LLTVAPVSWIARPRPAGGAVLRLFCFPYAGGTSVAYRGWSARLPPSIDVCPVQLPGRGARFRERAFDRLPDLLAAAMEGLRPHPDRPFAFFGHSMGALVAFELARDLRRRGGPMPIALFVSAHEAPHRPSPLPPVTHLSDDELVAEMRRRYDGIPEEVLAEPELLELLLPILRADVSVLESYEHVREAPLPCAVSCFSGSDDRHLTDDDLDGWREHTSEPFRLRVLPGGHFFINEEQSGEKVLAAIAEDLRPWLARA
jgi:medium-chain acyl-[acyl-carrier-protein] hydrolase